MIYVTTKYAVVQIENHTSQYNNCSSCVDLAKVVIYQIYNTSFAIETVINTLVNLNSHERFDYFVSQTTHTVIIMSTN